MKDLSRPIDRGVKPLLHSKHLHEAAPDRRPEPAGLFGVAADRDLLAEENSAAGEQIVEERIHPAIVAPERFRPHRPVIQVWREPHRRVLIGPPRRYGFTLAIHEPFGPHATASGDNQPTRTDEFEKAKLQRHPRLPAEELPAAPDFQSRSLAH